jgi:release factor glutamine methyltransferase
MNSKTLFQDLLSAIKLPESKEEIQNMVYLILEKIPGIAKENILSNKEIDISQGDQSKIANAIERLNKHEPIQYVLGEAFFFRRLFHVTFDVLIPRQETEELVNFVIKQTASIESPRILDIGTGSGCIPITLALEIPDATIYATDISRKALVVAADNANRLTAHVNFLYSDILTKEIPVGNIDVLVSNPPYITPQEKNSMQNNVLKYEPHLALFIPENDPLLFYKTILAKAKSVLNPNGRIVFEINENLGSEIRELMNSYASNVVIIKDLSGKDRIAKGILK